MVSGGEPNGAAFALGSTCFALGAIAFAASSIMVTVQRLHDLDRSGWFYLLGVVPVVGLLFFLYYGFVPGEEEANRFGPAHAPSGASRIVGPLSMGLSALVLVGYAVSVFAGFGAS